jgi:transcriptional regulator with XRE-family HTH domain
MKKLAELRNEVIRLRLQERLSLKEIQAKTGASRGSVSLWLQDYPLTREEQLEKIRIKRNGKTLGLKRLKQSPSKYYQMVDRTTLTGQKKAKIAEAAVLFRLTLHGFSPYGAMFDGEKADWIAANEATGRTLRIQVRSVKQEKYGTPKIKLRCSNGRGRSRRLRMDEFDILVGYDLVTDTAYVFTPEEIAHLSVTVSVCAEAAERWDKLNAS